MTISDTLFLLSAAAVGFGLGLSYSTERVMRMVGKTLAGWIKDGGMEYCGRKWIITEVTTQRKDEG